MATTSNPSCILARSWRIAAPDHRVELGALILIEEIAMPEEWGRGSLKFRRAPATWRSFLKGFSSAHEISVTEYSPTWAALLYNFAVSGL